MRRLVVLCAIAATGCPNPVPRRQTALIDPVVSDRGDARAALARELEAEVRASYERISLDAAAAAAAIDPSVGLVAIGTGPDDLAVGLAPPSRWPIVTVNDDVVTVASRALEVHLSSDETVGWSYDEASLELPVCGRVASVPIRVFQVYVRDSDRFVLVAEHVAYPQSMGQWLDGVTAPDGGRLGLAIERQPDSFAARDAITLAIAPDGDRAQVWDAGPDALAVWPDPLQVLRASATRLGPSLAQSLEATTVSLDGLRLGLGPSRAVAVASATLAGDITRVDGAGEHAVAVRLRATFVVERGAEPQLPWRVRAAMVSVPISTAALVSRTLGSAAIGLRAGAVTVACR
jgi:hypothetical protein